MTAPDVPSTDPAPIGKRQPTADELTGMAWWNNLSDWGRAYWLGIAGSAIAADAWGAWKAAQQGKR